MRAILADTAPHAFWLLLAFVALLLMVLGVVRALFPDFSGDGPSDAPSTVLPDRFTTTETVEFQAGNQRAALRNEGQD